jgi:superfamily II DNA or RNA helicase
MGAMERQERQHLRTTAQQVAGWVDQAQTIVGHRAHVTSAANEAVAALRSATVPILREGAVAWRVLPLRPSDGERLASVARHTNLPAVSAAEQQALIGLIAKAEPALHQVKSVVGARRFFTGKAKREAGASAAELLTRYQAWGDSANLPQLLDRLTPTNGSDPAEVPVGDALADWVGLVPRIADLGSDRQFLAAVAVAGLADAVRAIDAALAREDSFRRDAIAAGDAVRRGEVHRLLVDMPVERLRDATRERLRVGPLTDAGIRTVQAVLDRGHQLENLPGIGATTATRMRGAARTLWQTTYDEMPVRIDINNRTPQTTELLRRLHAWDAMRATRGATTDLALKDALIPLAHALDEQVSHLLVVAGDRPISEFTDAVRRVVHRSQNLSAGRSGSGSADPWDDFLARPADYFAMLAELGFLTEDEAKTHGDLPDEIVDAVRRLELDTEYLTASLRGYQSFGARFALVQRKVIIGDEMGLGKTIEALAVLAHLRAKGSHHFLVICPAAVVTNWIREVQSKSRLRPHRVHGPGREAAARSWIRSGGVAVTTYETLPWFGHHIMAPDDLGCVVVDEAHYIKNPDAQRSRRTARVIDLTDRAILLTGTPLENRIDEFRTLVGYLRPDLFVDATELAPRRFRLQVAPAYLRRNQEDVLTELPELVEVEEWLPMSSHDAAAYRDAVAAGNFMAMRQAAITHGGKSEKVHRLIEIVAEAEDNGRRVIVFSHFLNVLNQVTRSLPGQVFGPLTGSVPAAARQVIVDQFSAAGHGAVLVSQIVAGGVGLNIQAASVVVICEPQLKPTTEWQAIARAHRMGQLNSVQVHRLLSEEGVDQRITDILARKRQLFEEFARDSETAKSAPEAFDISEAELAREVLAAERERLFNQRRSQPEPGAESAAV